MCVCVTDGQTDKDTNTEGKSYIIIWQHFIVWFSVIYEVSWCPVPAETDWFPFLSRIDWCPVLIFRRSIASPFSSPNTQLVPCLLPDQLVLCSSVTCHDRFKARINSLSKPIDVLTRIDAVCLFGPKRECIFARRPVLIPQTLHARSANNGI